MGFSSNRYVAQQSFNPKTIPARFSSSGQTSTIQWGCPVQEVVEASTQAEAMQKISSSCAEQVRKEASEKPGVFDVIKVSLVWPDVKVTETNDGYLLKGTFFLEALVMKGQGGK